MRRRKYSPKTVVAFISMCVLAVIMLYPFAFMINTSFKSKAQYFGEPGHSTASWTKLFQTLPVWDQLLNSTVVCAGAISIILWTGVIICGRWIGFTLEPVLSIS